MNAKKAYEKTKQGFLMRLYHNMQSRVKGIQKNHAKYYEGLPIIEKKTFYFWAMKSIKFHKLFYEWQQSGYDRKLVPSIDRKDNTKGYTIENIQFLTLSNNCKKRWERRYVYVAA